MPILAAIEPATPGPTRDIPEAQSLARVEWEHIQRVLADCDGISARRREYSIFMPVAAAKPLEFDPDGRLLTTGNCDGCSYRRRQGRRLDRARPL